MNNDNDNDACNCGTFFDVCSTLFYAEKNGVDFWGF